MEKYKNDSKIELESNSKIIANNKFIAKKRKKSTIYKKFKNPGINHFNINSFFIYDLGKIQSIIYSIKDKNNNKMSDKDINSLSEEINKYSANIQLNKNEYDIKISEEDYYSINDYFSCQQNDNDLVSWLNKKINENDTRQKISCRKLSKIYEKEKGKKISLSYIYYNLKNKLHLHYLKTSIKKKVTMSRNSIFLCHCFLKIISRAISMGYDILFLDESSILSHNNNFRCWRKSNEQIYLNYDTEKRSNLLLIINKEKVIYYKINRKNTNEETFLEFFQEFLKESKKLALGKYLVVMDNLSCHKTPKLINYFVENKINIVFNCPYMSQFNCVELCFRYIKRQLYSNLFSSLDDVENYVKKLLDDKNNRKTLLKNYISTMKTYILYFDKNKNINLNNLEYNF